MWLIYHLSVFLSTTNFHNTQTFLIFVPLSTLYTTAPSIFLSIYNNVHKAIVLLPFLSYLITHIGVFVLQHNYNIIIMRMKADTLLDAHPAADHYSHYPAHCEANPPIEIGPDGKIELS